MIRLPHVIARLDHPGQPPQIVGWEAKDIMATRHHAQSNGAICLNFRATTHLVYRGYKNRYGHTSDIHTNALVSLLAALIPEIEADIHPGVLVIRPRPALIIESLIVPTTPPTRLP
ncbi:MAG: hypothetical protein EOO77_28690 [Oxalobacteraceae bacterium]|nr:MAG: hypothetical protein EOO77_28690 [Oxalobacteraceae bacterium]